MTTDSQGNIYLAGAAYPGFPVTPGAAQTQPGGGTCLSPTGSIGPPLTIPCPDAFAAKVSVSGTNVKIIWATFLGGPTTDAATGIALDAAGNVYITGTTGGSFPITPHAYYPSSDSGVFVAKLNSQGTQVLYSTNLPGTKNMNIPTAPPSITVDVQGNAFITGNTSIAQVLVVKLSPDGSARLYNTMPALPPSEYSHAITIDSTGNAYITGSTYTSNFPVTSGAFQKALAGVANAFIVKLDPVGNVVLSTYLGGSGSDTANAIAVDSQGNIYVAGQTTSLDFPTTAGAWEPRALIPLSATAPAGPGGFAAKLSPEGDKLVYSSFVFSDSQGVLAMALDAAGGAYLTGLTYAGLSVTASAPQPCFSGGENVFVAHVNQNGALVDRTYAGSGTPFIAFGPPPQIPFGVTGLGSALLVGSGIGLAQLHFGDSSYAPPSCLSPAILNAATFTDAPQIAPGELVSLTGIGLGPAKGASYQPGPDGSVPRELSGVQVFFGDLAAPLLYVQSQQINAMVPFELAGQTSTAVRVQYNGAGTNSVNVAVGIASPGIFRVQPGLSAQPAVVNQDGTLNDAAHPAKAGSVISLYGTGFGQTDPPGITGSVFPLEPAPLQPAAMAPLCISINGCTEIQYAGAAPSELVGIDQINVRVPPASPQSALSISPYYVLVSSAAQDPVELIIYVHP